MRTFWIIVLTAYCSISSGYAVWAQAGLEGKATEQKTAAFGSRQTAAVFLQADSLGAYYTADSTLYVYPNANTNEHSETHRYAGRRDSLVFQGKSVYIRNAQAKATFIIDLSWDASSNSFDTTRRLSYSYDAAGDTIQELMEYATLGSIRWVPHSRLTKAYTSSHQLRLFTREQYSASSTWDTVHRYEYTYNTLGLPVYTIYRHWQTSIFGVEMDYVDSSLYSYDVSGLVLLKDSTYKWTSSTQTYKLTERTLYTVNSSNQMIVRQAEVWNNIMAAWVPGLRYSFSYTANGYRAADTVASWYASLNAFKPGARHLYDWNSFGQQTFFSIQTIKGSSWIPYLTWLSYYEPYQELAISQPLISTQGLLLDVFPNPASGSLTAQFAYDQPTSYVVQLTDMFGKVVYHQSVHGTKQSIDIAVGALQNGNYILSVKAASGAMQSRVFTVTH